MSLKHLIDILPKKNLTSKQQHMLHKWMHSLPVQSNNLWIAVVNVEDFYLHLVHVAFPEDLLDSPSIPVLIPRVLHNYQITYNAKDIRGLDILKIQNMSSYLICNVLLTTYFLVSIHDGIHNEYFESKPMAADPLWNS